MKPVDIDSGLGIVEQLELEQHPFFLKRRLEVLDHLFQHRRQRLPVKVEGVLAAGKFDKADHWHELYDKELNAATARLSLSGGGESQQPANRTVRFRRC